MCRNILFYFSSDKSLHKYLAVLARMARLDFLLCILYGIIAASGTDDGGEMTAFRVVVAVLFAVCGVALRALVDRQTKAVHTVCVLFNFVFLIVYLAMLYVEGQEDEDDDDDSSSSSAASTAVTIGLAVIIVIYKVIKFKIIVDFRSVLSQTPLLDAEYSPIPAAVPYAVPVGQPMGPAGKV